jgi:HEAT repeat protein
MNHRALAPLALLLALAASCSSSSKESDNVVTSRWIEPAPILKQQIRDEADRLPWTSGFERLEQIRWFASIGEPAYETLLGLACDPRDDVAAAALASLGATMDRRLVTSIKGLRWDQKRKQSDLSLERARTLLRLGDWSDIPTLIRGLRDDRLYTRSLCLEALREATHETHGFDPRSEPSARDLAVSRWEQWWIARGGEGLLDS